MTGITWFLYENEDKGWKYNWTEYLTDDQKLVFTHLFTDWEDIPKGFVRHKSQLAFDKINFKQWKVQFKKAMYIYERSDVYEQRWSASTSNGTDTCS